MFVGANKAFTVLLCVTAGVTTGPSAKSRPPNAPFALIIEPSRELAEQTHSQITRFKKHLPKPQISELLVMGGTNVKDQIDALYAGVSIVTCSSPC